MPLQEPQFDSRAYRDILNDALARIPVHNPNWTNFTDADPGVTVLQLFSFLTESIIYRANLIPERNRRKFLRLLGQNMQAATAATGIVTFANPRRIPGASLARRAPSGLFATHFPRLPSDIGRATKRRFVSALVFAMDLHPTPPTPPLLTGKL